MVSGQRSKKIQKRLCEHLCEQLFVGNLIAIGTQTHPVKENSKKEILNLEFQFLLHQNSEKLEEFENFSFGPKKPFAEWDQDKFQGRTVLFEEVRIFDPSSARIELESEKRERGRPPTWQYIEEAYEECKKNNGIDFSASQKTAIKAVIKRLRKKHPKKFEKLHSGFGSEAVRKVISSVRWSRKIGQLVKVYSTGYGGIRDDEATEVYA